LNRRGWTARRTCELGVRRDHILVSLQHVGAPDHLFHGGKAHGRHQLAALLGDHEQEVDDMLRLPIELGT
jgi:hypothetical protein